MDLELTPLTNAGRRFTALAEEHARDFATRAEQHDREGSFPVENIEALRRSGASGATVPSELGGLGVESVHDYVAGVNRLGRGDGSTGLAANMHIFRTLFVARAWRAAEAAGRHEEAARSAALLRRIASGDVIIAAILTETGADHLHIRTEATRRDSGWVLNGRKSFGTGSPAADLLGILCRYRDGAGRLRMALAHVSARSPGVEIKDNWDALGMRGSGSHDVVFTNCVVPAADFIDTGPWGEYTERYLAGNAVGTLGLVAVFLGIAEAAREHTLTMLKTDRGRRLAARRSVQYAVAEIEIKLATSRALVARAGTTLDTFLASHGLGPLPMDELHEVMKDFQCTKWVVTRQAIEIVDSALTLSGGAGYLTKSPLSRLYRDVRAGPFMQPFSPNEALEYIGKVSLGQDPSIDGWSDPEGPGSDGRTT
jgi:alkylation response protein AidB-like acyl-CoA dehydrogenase